MRAELYNVNKRTDYICCLLTFILEAIHFGFSDPQLLRLLLQELSNQSLLAETFHSRLFADHLSADA